MYLTEIDENTGLVKIDKNNDGVLAIKEFRDLIENEEYGIFCLTAVALVADYQSPIRYYNSDDRPRKAQEEVTGNRDFWIWKEEIIQKALVKYEALQHDPTLEEGRIYYEQKINKLKDIQDYDKLPLNDEKRKLVNMSDLKKELRAINSDIDDYKKRTEGTDLYQNSPVKNGYELSRLEQKLEKRNSFYHSIR